GSASRQLGCGEGRAAASLAHMNKKSSGSEIERLIALLARLPGLGHRSARKAALALIKRREDLLQPLAAALRAAGGKIIACPSWGNIATVSPGRMGGARRRDRTPMGVGEKTPDRGALERAGVVTPLYPVLGGPLPPLDGSGPEELNVARLIERAVPPVKEVLL